MPCSCSVIINAMEELAPARLTQNWDNTGLLLGDSGQHVSKVLVALDITPEVVEEAVTRSTELIITHHPVIFQPLRNIRKDKPVGQMLFKLIQNNISVYSAHTNLDMARGGVNDTLASILKLENVQILQPLESENTYGFARIGKLSETTELAVFAETLKSLLGSKHVRMVGDAKKKINSVVVSSGSYNSITNIAREKCADVIVTGDLKYHDARDILDCGLSAVDAGHFSTENIIVPVIIKHIFSKLNNMDIKVIKSEKSQDIFTVI